MINLMDFPVARPYAAHGVTFRRQSGEELVGDCPFTGKREKFYLNIKNGAWHSKTQGVGGGLPRFLFMSHEIYRDVRELPKLLQKLGTHRQLPGKAFTGWFLGWDGQRYVIPVRNHRGRIQDLRLYDAERKQMRSTPGCNVGLLGVHQFTERPSDPIYVCEGEWDAIAMQWLLNTVYKPGIAVAVPGATTFKTEWVEWFKGRDVYACYDADPAGDHGEALLKRRLTGVAHSIRYVHWPDVVPRGFDLRDWIVHAINRQTPEPCYEKLHERFQDEPRLERRAQPKSFKIRIPVKEPKRVVPIHEVHTTFQKWLHLPNTDGIDVMLAIAYAVGLEGPPLWLFMVSPPGGAKTVMLTSLAEWSQTFFTSALTPHALISGASGIGQSDPSLIPRLNGRLLVVKDYTPVLAMREQDQGEIHGIMRDAYDGRCGKVFGNGIERTYESRFGVLAGVTPRIYDRGEENSSMGERFLKYVMGDNLHHISEDRIIARAIENADQSEAMQKELTKIITAFLEGPRGPLPEITPEYQTKIIHLSQFGARIRGTVSKDFRGEHITGRPFAEVGSRLGVQLSKLARCLAWVRRRPAVTEEDYRIVVKVMLDTVAQRQEDLLRALYKRDGTNEPYATTQELSLDTRYPNVTVRRMLEDMHMLQIVERKPRGLHTAWRLGTYIRTQIHGADLYARVEELTRRPQVVIRVPRQPRQTEEDD